jgi:hypothetical protein
MEAWAVFCTASNARGAYGKSTAYTSLAIREAMTAEDDASGRPDALTIPSWIREPVAQVARKLYAYYLECNKVQHAAVLERLVVDKRMRRVWSELFKHRRNQYQKTDALLYPTYLLWIDSKAPQDHQDAAIWSLLHHAVNNAVNKVRVITRKELETVRHNVSAEVVALRIAATVLRRYGKKAIVEDVEAAADDEAVKAPAEEVAALRTAATVLRRYGKKAVAEEVARYLEEMLPKMEASRLVVDRNTDSAQARCFCILFIDFCRQLFGRSLYRVTGIVASVALEQKITDQAVRSWCKRSAQASAPHTAKAACIKFLQTLLANGRIEVADITTEALAAGLLAEGRRLKDNKPMRDARAALKIQTRRVGFGKGARYFWALPRA